MKNSIFIFYGEMAEGSIASDLKLDELIGSVSSNLTLSLVFFNLNFKLLLSLLVLLKLTFNFY